MELLAVLKQTKDLERIRYSGLDGVIFGSSFCLKSPLSIATLKKVCEYCDLVSLKKYIVIDAFVPEELKSELYVYFDILLSCKVDGIYFHDLAVYDVALSYGRTDLLIYDGMTMMANSLEASFFLNKGISGVVIGRELSLEEVTEMIGTFPNQLDMQVFGRFRLSYSKRDFLTDYFEETGQLYDVRDRDDVTLMEETRNYKMPVIENNYGTQIYTDFIFEMYRELPILGPYLKRAIIDSAFIPEKLYFKVLRDYKRLTKDNVDFLRESLYNDYANEGLSSGYLYEKVNITKVK